MWYVQVSTCAPNSNTKISIIFLISKYFSEFIYKEYKNFKIFYFLIFTIFSICISEG